MRLTLNDQATQEFLALMKLYDFTNPTHAINKLVSTMFNTATNKPANPSEVTHEPETNNRNQD